MKNSLLLMILVNHHLLMKSQKKTFHNNLLPSDVLDKKKSKYPYSDKAKNSIKKNTKEYTKFIEKEKSKIKLQRFKGLGEMNPEELWQTTLNPQTRTLLQVKYSNNTKAKSKKDQDLIQILMGDEVAPRKEFIINRALEVSNLDI